ncbi:DUF6404 family protein [Roseibium sp. RKSG952]|uniref:DUF6404 family protein n=1 Tax=Roseibium sp. RKSG952 TaxID=2529384 RepID=UPI0034CF5DFB
MIDYEVKFQRATAELERAGLQKHAKPAPFVRFLRGAGFRPKPDLYRRKISRLMWDTLVMGSLWGLGMYIFSPSFRAVPPLAMSSLLYGVSMALFAEYNIWRTRRKHKLSKWEDL